VASGIPFHVRGRYLDDTNPNILKDEPCANAPMDDRAEPPPRCRQAADLVAGGCKNKGHATECMPLRSEVIHCTAPGANRSDKSVAVMAPPSHW
jgi:hypothetical protein